MHLEPSRICPNSIIALQQRQLVFGYVPNLEESLRLLQVLETTERFKREFDDVPEGEVALEALEDLMDSAFTSLIPQRSRWYIPSQSSPLGKQESPSWSLRWHSNQGTSTCFTSESQIFSKSPHKAPTYSPDLSHPPYTRRSL